MAIQNFVEVALAVRQDATANQVRPFAVIGVGEEYEVEPGFGLATGRKCIDRQRAVECACRGVTLINA